MNEKLEKMIGRILRCPKMFNCQNVRDAIRCIEGVSIGYSLKAEKDHGLNIQRWAEERYKCSSKIYWGDLFEENASSISELKNIFDDYFNQ